MSARTRLRVCIGLGLVCAVLLAFGLVIEALIAGAILVAMFVLAARA